jgi:exodeoxyribonuclease-3
MSDDTIQGMLFAGFGDQPAVDDHVADTELHLCTLNINSPSPARAQRLVDWLAATSCNALVLTEVQAGPACDLIRTTLDAHGYHLQATPGWRDQRFHTIVAAKGFRLDAVQPAGFDPRITTVDLTSAGGTIRLVGVYAPTNGMTPDSSHRRRVFQQQFTTYLADIFHPKMCVIGDLNVVEPRHQPHLSNFEDHDYAFYRGLLDLGLRDAYRSCHPDGADHSWISPRFGSQRLDHALLSEPTPLTSCAYEHTPRLQELTDHSALQLVVRLTHS